MWKSFFLAIGITLIIIGVECLVIDRALLTDAAVATQQVSYSADPLQPTVPVSKEVVPPEWAPWSLMSTGVVIILYSFSIPRRVQQG